MLTSKLYHSYRTDNFFIDHTMRLNPYDMKQKHYHPQYEIYYLLDGDRNYFIQDRVYNITKGDLVLIKSNVLHKTVDGFLEGHERILIEFNFNFFHDFLTNNIIQNLMLPFLNDFHILRFEDVYRKQLLDCFFKLMKESKERNTELDELNMIKSYFLELLLLISKLNKKKPNSKEFKHPTKLHKNIAEVIDYINLHYKKDIGLDCISDHFQVSSAHLSRSFKKITGFTFVEYLNNLRIQEAQKLLITSKLSITKIGNEVGYQNITHFGRMFKAIIGHSPREYRNLYKDGL